MFEDLAEIPSGHRTDDSEQSEAQLAGFLRGSDYLRSMRMSLWIGYYFQDATPSRPGRPQSRAPPYDRAPSVYSWRKASIGETRVARRAGR